MDPNQPLPTPAPTQAPSPTLTQPPAATSAPTPIPQRDYSELQKSSNLAGDLLFWLSIPLGLAVGIGFMVLAVMFGAGDHATLAIIAFVAGLTGFCLPFIRAKVVKGKQISQFASANNMSYSMGISAAFNTRMKGMFANSNSIENAVVTEVLHSTADPFSELGNIQFSIVRADLGLHREIDTIHTWGFAKVTLPNSLPHIILDSLTNDMFGLGSLPGSLDKKQRLSLEGELDTKFALYAPLDYATDAYYIFPPSVLIQFTNLSQPYDIEIIEDAMYIYRHNKFDLGNPQDIQEATWIAATLKQIILTKAKKYNDTFKDILTDEQRSREGQNLQT